jgi:hypothetical protein
MFILTIFSLCCCGKAPPKTFVGPSGNTAYSFNCIYKADYCLLQAEAACPNGYNIISGSSPESKRQKRSAEKTREYNLVVECK